MPEIPGVPDHAAPEELPQPRYAVEPKVKAAAAGAGGGAILSEFAVWGADAIWWNGDAPPDVPFPVAGAITFVVTGVCAFVAGYMARHVNRLPVVE